MAEIDELGPRGQEFSIPHGNQGREGQAGFRIFIQADEMKFEPIVALLPVQHVKAVGSDGEHARIHHLREAGQYFVPTVFWAVQIGFREIEATTDIRCASRRTGQLHLHQNRIAVEHYRRMFAGNPLGILGTQYVVDGWGNPRIQNVSGLTLRKESDLHLP